MAAKAKKLDSIVKSLTVLEAAELARMLEKKWSVPAEAAERPIVNDVAAANDDQGSFTIVLRIGVPGTASFELRLKEIAEAFEKIGAEGWLGPEAEKQLPTGAIVLTDVFAEPHSPRASSTLKSMAEREPESQREMAEIIRRISSWAGGEKEARLWYRSEAISAFGGRTAEALVNEGRSAEVRDFSIMLRSADLLEIQGPRIPIS